MQTTSSTRWCCLRGQLPARPLLPPSGSQSSQRQGRVWTCAAKPHSYCIAEQPSQHGSSHALQRLAAASAAALLLQLTAAGPAPLALAAEAPVGGQQVAEQAAPATSPAAQTSARQVYLDLQIDGEPAGRVTVRLFDEAPVGAARFVDLAAGRQGVSFRSTKIDAITPAYVRDAGVRRLSRSAEATTRVAGGDTVEDLEAELALSRRHHDGAGLVSLVVRDSTPRPTKEKLVAYNGKLVTVQETLGEAPNGTAFIISLAAAPELDATNLIIGQVQSGLDVVRNVASLPTVKSNKNSPYFRMAKVMGDKRADVAEKGFGRPFAKVTVAASGVASG